MTRYMRRLADRDLALDRSMIPLGSCTNEAQRHSRDAADFLAGILRNPSVRSAGSGVGL